MQKVKVQRYIPGKRPEYAPAESDEDDSGEEWGPLKQQRGGDEYGEREMGGLPTEAELDDPRLRRLMSRQVISEHHEDRQR